MPVRGRPERPRTSGSAGVTQYGLDDSRGGTIGLGLKAERAPFEEIGLGLFAVRSVVDEVELGLMAVEQVVETIGLGLTVIDVEDLGGGQIQVTRPAVGLGLLAGPTAGHCSAPRVVTPDSISVGQEVQRRGQIIPTVD